MQLLALNQRAGSLVMTYVEAAMLYARELGWPLFPAHPITKRPLIKTGRDHAEHASREPELLADWFEAADVAIAMPTGAASGVVVIDADAKHDGERVLAELELRYGALPRTKVVRTQSGGIHVYLRHPGAGIRVKSCVGGDSTPWPERGVDVRGDGGIVLLPPSNGYAWEVDEGAGFEPMPVGWVDVLRDDRRVLAHVEIGEVVYTAADDHDLDAHRAALAHQRARLARRKDPEDAARVALLDRVLRGEALGTIGERDSAVTRAGYMVGRYLPDIGPDVAERLAFSSLILIPVPVGDHEDSDFWIQKFRNAYEAGARASREQYERDRQARERLARLFGGAR
ncbi:MAG: bifunctional DNA primase/polymerase [Kofleriaceae bacterium]|nr:bifunctional DNA primase/polymerase [Kofleriaceae bacterium]